MKICTEVSLPHLRPRGINIFYSALGIYLQRDRYYYTTFKNLEEKESHLPSQSRPRSCERRWNVTIDLSEILKIQCLIINTISMKSLYGGHFRLRCQKISYIMIITYVIILYHYHYINIADRASSVEERAAWRSK